MPLQVENVTCTACSWGGKCELQTLLDGPAPPPTTCSSRSSATPDVDLPGSDFASAPAADYSACSDRCCDTASCVAWVYVTTLHSKTPEGGCAPNGSCCWLKGSVPTPDTNHYAGGIWSGTATQPPPPPVIVPPTGIRDAVPTGGLGAGTFELRGDGTFHEITIHSASPAGSAKYGSQPDMMLSYQVNGGVTRAIRTAPPAYASPGVSELTYRGTYPVGRLDIIDPSSLSETGLTLSAFVYHHFVPSDAPTSSAPAVVFTLTITNDGTSPANASFLFQLPFGAMSDCSRVDFNPSVTSVTTTAAECLHSCAAAGSADCAAWNWASATGTCDLLPSAGRMVFAAGVTCGLAGTWDSSSSSYLSLSMHATDAHSPTGPAWGDVAIRPVGPSLLSFAVSDDPAALYAAFAASGGGGFAPGNNNGVTGGSFAGIAAAHGAVSVSSGSIAPGETASVSITLAWYFPGRDYHGRVVGQHYATQWASAAAVADLYDADHIADVASSAVAHTSVWADNSLPAWLQDHLVNQFSHARNFIYAADGSMREHEANDCPDLDSVHNDYQRQ